MKLKLSPLEMAQREINLMEDRGRLILDLIHDDSEGHACTIRNITADNYDASMKVRVLLDQFQNEWVHVKTSMKPKGSTTLEIILPQLR